MPSAYTRQGAIEEEVVFMPAESSWSKHFGKASWKAIRAIINTMENWMAFCAAVFLLVMMFGIVGDAVMRYLFNHPLSIAYEFSEFYILPAVIFFTISYTMKRRGHIGVTLFHQFLSARTVKAIENGGLLIGTLLFAVIAWQGANLTYFAWYNNFVTTGIYKWPLYAGYAFVPLGSSVMSMRCFADFINEVLFHGGEHK